MSAAPKPKRTNLFSEQTPIGGLDFSLSDESISSVLRDATFVSSHGQVYRLFPEESKNPALGESFSLASQKVDELSDRLHEPEPFKLFGTESEKVFADHQPLSDLLSDNSRTENLEDASGIPMLSNPQNIEETFKRLRGVEGTIGRNQKTLPVQMFDNISEKILRKSNPTAKNQVLSPALSQSAKPLSKKEAANQIHKTLSLLSLTEMKTNCSYSIQEPIQKKPSFDPSELPQTLPIFPDIFVEPGVDSASILKTFAEKSDGQQEQETSEQPEIQVENPLGAGDGETCKELKTSALIDVSPKQASIPEIPQRIQLFRIDFPHSLKQRCKTGLFTKKIRNKKENIVSKICRSVSKEQIFPDIEKRNDVIEDVVSSSRFDFSAENTVTVQRGCGLNESEAEKLSVSDTTHQEVVPSIFKTSDKSIENPIIETSQVVWKPRWPEHIDSLGNKASRQIRVLCNHLTGSMKKGVKAINFNSFYPGEGCTTSLICVARELAARNYHVLMVDAHARHPELSELLCDSTDSLEYGIVHLENGLEFLPWSEIPIEMEIDGKIATKHVSDLLTSLYTDYDFVLIDNGRLIEGRLDDRIEFWNKISSNGVLLVVNRKNAGKFQLETVVARLKKHNVELIGLMENYV